MNAFILLLSAIIGLEPVITRLCGATSIDEVPTDRVEYFYSLNEHPILLNSASRSKLMSMGVLTPFQIASILDYIERNGSILSTSELASVVGIDERLASDLSYFLSYESDSPVGQAFKNPCVKSDASMRSTLKSGALSSLFKVRADYDDKIEAAACVKEKLESWYLRCDFRLFPFLMRGRFSAILGSFNANLGQGLLLWSGFQMNSFTGVSAFSKNPSGFVVSNSSSSKSNMSGVVLSYDAHLGGVSFSCAEKGVMVLHSDFYTKRSSFGATMLREKGEWGLSADFKSTLGKITFWTELAGRLRQDGVVSSALVAGCMYNYGYRRRVGFRGQFCGSQFGGKNRISVGCDWLKMNFVADALKDDKGAVLKTTIRYASDFEIKDWSCEYEFRHKGQFKSDVLAENAFRTKALFRRKNFFIEPCLEVKKGTIWSKSFFIKLGEKTDKRSLAGFIAAFDAPLWKERLYISTPDVPGSFNVKAFYGRGVELGAYAGVKDIVMRVSWKQYFDDKPSNFEMRFFIRLKSSFSVKARKPD